MADEGWSSGGLLADEWRALKGPGIATLAIAGPSTAFVLGALLQIGLWGTLADQVFENRSPEGFLRTLGDAGSRIPRIAVITLVAGLLQTVVFCAPWLVVVICSPFIYFTRRVRPWAGSSGSPPAGDGSRDMRSPSPRCSLSALRSSGLPTWHFGSSG
jgi:hypothetical protein